jgi:hypothetical protein
LGHSSARLSEAAPALAADVLMENVVLRLSPAVMHGIAGVSWLARGKRASGDPLGLLTADLTDYPFVGLHKRTVRPRSKHRDECHTRADYPFEVHGRYGQNPQVGGGPSC